MRGWLAYAIAGSLHFVGFMVWVIAMDVTSTIIAVVACLLLAAAVWSAARGARLATGPSAEGYERPEQVPGIGEHTVAAGRFWPARVVHVPMAFWLFMHLVPNDLRDFAPEGPVWGLMALAFVVVCLAAIAPRRFAQQLA